MSQLKPSIKLGTKEETIHIDQQFKIDIEDRLKKVFEKSSQQFLETLKSDQIASSQLEILYDSLFSIIFTNFLEEFNDHQHRPNIFKSMLEFNFQSINLTP